MFVKKFEADTLDEALKAVKVELGPDAIILKTVTNKGLKGAFKKKRIEITAAISERNYEKKARVDHILPVEQKEDFYSHSSENLADAIDNYATKRTPQASPTAGAGYGQLGLNRMVNTIQKGVESAAKSTSQVLKNSLDDFLSDETDTREMEDDSFDEELLEQRFATKQATPKTKPVQQTSQLQMSQQEAATQVSGASRELVHELRQELRTQQHKITQLEQRLFEIAEKVQNGVSAAHEAKGVFQLRTTLKTLDIDEAVVVDLIRKATYELSHDELENPDVVFEFALREMTQAIHTALPLFSTVDGDEPVITVLLSEAASGQTCMAMKVAVLKKDVVVVQYSSDGVNSSSADFAAQVFGLKIERAQNPGEMVGLCRQACEAGKSVLIDLRLTSKHHDETKKFIESMRRGFQHVEVLVTLSAIHSELYNRKILSRYKELADGLIISHVDLCLNFGALFNVHRAHNKLPLKFFGTGPVVPDDVEGATAERVMAGLFQL